MALLPLGSGEHPHSARSLLRAPPWETGRGASLVLGRNEVQAPYMVSTAAADRGLITTQQRCGSYSLLDFL